MRCTNHREVPGIGVCIACRKVLCDDCATRLQGRNFCVVCLAERGDVSAGSSSAGGRLEEAALFLLGLAASVASHASVHAWPSAVRGSVYSSGGVGHVPAHELHGSAAARLAELQPLEVLEVAAREVVQHPHAIPAGTQRPSDVGSDEAGAAGDQVQCHGAQPSECRGPDDCFPEGTPPETTQARRHRGAGGPEASRRI